MSQQRGKTLHREFPRWLAAYWPQAEACPPGRSGRDVDGIPGIAWEIKAAGEDNNYRPAQWVRQAARNAGPDLPVVTWFPPGVGIGSVDATVSILPTMELLRLLKEAGYMP